MVGAGAIVFKGRRLSGGVQLTGEKIPGDLANWDIMSSDANSILTSSYKDLSDRSTTLFHTNGIAAGAINKQALYAIGPGLVFRSQPDYRALGMNEGQARDFAVNFQWAIDYVFKMVNFYSKQKPLFTSGLASGDSLLWFLREGDSLDFIESPGNQIDYSVTGKKGDKTYLLGVEVDDWLRRKGIIKVNGKNVPFRDENLNQNVAQFYEKSLARQVRGYPLLYRIINLCKNDDRHTDAITQRAVIEALIIATQKGDRTNMGKKIRDLQDKARARKTGGNMNSFVNKVAGTQELTAGNILTMGGDEEFEFLDMKAPSSNLDKYKEMIIDYVGAATDTPPEVILSKYNTSYTAHMGAKNDFYVSFMNKRKGFSRSIMNVAVEQAAIYAIQNGMIDAPGFFDNPIRRQAYLSGKYLGPVPGQINALVETKADALKVEEGFALRGDMASNNENDFENMLSTWERQEQDFANSQPEEKAEAIED